MFSQVNPSLISDTYQSEKLREIDVSNENQQDQHHQHQYATKIAQFLSTHAYYHYNNFILTLNKTCQGKTKDDVTFIHPAVSSLLSLLDNIEKLIDLHPPIVTTNTENSKSTIAAALPQSRFGNVAFRSFVQSVKESTPSSLRNLLTNYTQLSSLPHLPKRQILHSSTNQSTNSLAHLHIPKNLPPKVRESLRLRGELPDQHQDEHMHDEEEDSVHPEDASYSNREIEVNEFEKEISPEEKLNRVIEELGSYLIASFGNERRIDYGTGHEMNFFCFLYSLESLGVFQSTDLSLSTSAPIHLQFVLIIFPRYLSLLYRLQTTYWLEPAGSRGVWGLDDYSFLPFLFGSSQLIDHPHIKPKSVRYPDILEAYSTRYLYLSSIAHLDTVKSSTFAVHSPLLYDITACKTWKQVNNGLLKMYQAEVLQKWPVVQHFIYSYWLKKDVIREVRVEELNLKEEVLCCSDVVHFPASIAAKAMEQ